MKLDCLQRVSRERAEKRADKPLLYAHSTAIVGGWPKEAVDTVTMGITSFIDHEVYLDHTGFPPGPKIRRAVAAFLISGVYNEKVADCATHYPRKAERYTDVPRRYRVDDEFDTHYYRTKAADILADPRVGLITHEIGVWAEHRESTYLPTGEAIALISGLIDIHALNPALCSEVIQLRERGDGPGHKRLMPYTDTPEIVARRKRVMAINKESATLVVYRDGHKMPTVRYHQTFSETWDQCGRLSCSGTSFQSIHAHERLELQIVDNATGERCPVAEYDFDNTHFVMLYKEAGVKPPSGDLYRIPGFDRKHCKWASVIGINAKGTSSGLLAVAKKVGYEEFLELARNRGGYLSPKHQGETYTHQLVDAIREKHHKVAHLFFGDWGVKFQWVEAQIALRVMERMIEATGQPPLCVHDGFVVPEQHGPTLAKIMREEAQRQGLDLGISKKKKRRNLSSEDLSDDHPLKSIPTEPIVELPKTSVINQTWVSNMPPTGGTYRCGDIYLFNQVEPHGTGGSQSVASSSRSVWNQMKTRYFRSHGHDPPDG